MFWLIKKLINSKIKHGEHMTKQVFLTKTVVDAFIEEGNLNERQIYIIKTRALGYTIVKQAEELHLSVDQNNKDISYLKKLYDATQKSSKILPVRKRNKAQLFK